MARRVESFSLYRRTLSCARKVAGSEKLLARRLHVPLADLRAWLDGAEPPPRAVFLAAVDILVDPDAPVAPFLHGNTANGDFVDVGMGIQSMDPSPQDPRCDPISS
jgi:hypothetical protein